MNLTRGSLDRESRPALPTAQKFGHVLALRKEMPHVRGRRRGSRRAARYPVRRMAEVNASDVDGFSVNDLCPFVRSREAIPRIIDL
ncbi:MAG TPA: hypothetical protein VIX84_19970 [Acidimicrobiales bacterium]